MTFYFLFSVPNYLRSFRVSSEECPWSAYLSYDYTYKFYLIYKIEEGSKYVWLLDLCLNFESELLIQTEFWVFFGYKSFVLNNKYASLESTRLYEVHRVLVTQSCPFLCDPMDSSLPAPLSMGLSRQEYCGGLPCPPPGDLPNTGIEPSSPTLQVDSFPTNWATREAHIKCIKPSISWKIQVLIVTII